MEGVVDSIVEPGLFHDVDFRAVAALVADFDHAVAHDPERRPMPRLLLKLDAGDVVAEGMLELAVRPHAAVEKLVAVLQGAHDQMALAVQGDRPCETNSHHAAAFGDVPFFGIQYFPLNSSCQISFQVLPSGRRRQRILDLLGNPILSNNSGHNDSEQTGDLHILGPRDWVLMRHFPTPFQETQADRLRSCGNIEDLTSAARLAIFVGLF